MDGFCFFVLIVAVVVLCFSIYVFITCRNTDKFGDDLPDCVYADQLKSNMCTLENLPGKTCGSFSLRALENDKTKCKLKPCCNNGCSAPGQYGIHCSLGDCHGDMRNPVGCILSDCNNCDFNNPHSLNPDCEICCNYLKK